MTQFQGAFHSFGVASTALCLEALLSAGNSPRCAGHRAGRGLSVGQPSKVAARRPGQPAQRLGLLLRHAGNGRAIPGGGRPTPICRRLLEKLIGEQPDGLKRCETIHGGWFYYASGFQRPLAPSCELRQRRRAGRAAPGQGARHRGRTGAYWKRAIQTTADQRNPDSSFLYSMESPLSEAGGAPGPDQPPRRQPRPVAGVRPGAAPVGRPDTSRMTCSRGRGTGW